MEKAGAASSGWRPTAGRPLAGVKVLDLTRVLAGPAATRFLAGYGADVLRIDPPDWNEPAIEPEVTLGKRCARLDLRQASDRSRFELLISEADLFIHGYRPEALDALGYGEDIRRALNPSLVDVRLDAYGWSGPWRSRRGFDSLVQMSTGIAAAGRAWCGGDKPVPLPVQALDHATGYLMAAAAVHGLALRLSRGQATSAGLSLARTAALLMGTPRQGIEPKALIPCRRGLFGRHRSHRLGIGASRAAACRGRGRADGLDASGLTPGLRASGVGILSGADRASAKPKGDRRREGKPQRCIREVLKGRDLAVGSGSLCSFAGRRRRVARPSPESVIVRGQLLVAQQPRDIRRHKTRVFEILERKTTAHLVNDLAESRPFGR